MNPSDRNRYAPPGATVADVESDDLVERPASVVRAVKLLWASLAIGFVVSIVGLFLTPDPAFAGLTLTVTIVAVGVGYTIAFGISWWIYGAIYDGRNWARILLLVLMAFSVVAIVGMYAMLLVSGEGLPPLSAFDAISSGVEWTLATYALVLLFMRPANEWFRAIKLRG